MIIALTIISVLTVIVLALLAYCAHKWRIENEARVKVNKVFEQNRLRLVKEMQDNPDMHEFTRHLTQGKR